LTFLLFLKMADEQSRRRSTSRRAHAQGLRLAELLAKDGDELETHYRHTLEELGKKPGMLGSFSARRRTRSRTRPSCGG
jgi:type I restriction enzyme M protein